MKLRMYLKEMRGLMKISSVYGVALFASAVSLLSVGCNGSEDFQSGSSLSSNDVSGIVFTSGDSSFQTRTSISHTLGGGAKAVWSTGDKIWVKDNSGVFQQSGVGSFSSGMTRGSFSFSSGSFSNGCLVNYTGSNSSSGTAVTIASTQSQSVPNNFDHAGASGDCGTAVASGNGTAFTFKLDHKASYLCFLPRCTNADLGANIVLTKIVVTSTNSQIAGTYDFSTGSLSSTPISNGSNTITLLTNNFPLTNTTTSIATNGSYMVVAPGSHNFTIDYYIKDVATNVEGSITKTLSLTTVAGNIHDITANLTPADYSSSNYFMWDAAQNYWQGKEAYQPTSENTSSTEYPQTNADSRYFNDTAFPVEATSVSMKDMPNANEMYWYVKYGNPYWDQSTLWSMKGHLYNAGLWIKKAATLQTEGTWSDVVSPLGIDLRVSGTADYSLEIVTPVVLGKPSVAQLNSYFYLPAMGHYYTEPYPVVSIYGGYFWNINKEVTWWSRTGAEVSNNVQNNRMAVAVTASISGMKWAIHHRAHGFYLYNWE